MKATFDGYLYVAENGAESDDGKWWFAPERVPGSCLPVRGMPSPVQLIGGPRDGEIVKRGCDARDHEDMIEAVMRDMWFKVRHDLDFDRSLAGQLKLAGELAEIAVNCMEPCLDCVALHCAKFYAIKAVKSFCVEYYGAD